MGVLLGGKVDPQSAVLCCDEQCCLLFYVVGEFGLQGWV